VGAASAIGLLAWLLAIATVVVESGAEQSNDRPIQRAVFFFGQPTDLRVKIVGQSYL